MSYYGATAQERMMKVQEVILRAMAKKITWWQAAEVIGISNRQMRRWKHRYQEYGYDGLYDRRRGKPSPRRVPVETVELVARTCVFQVRGFSPQFPNKPQTSKTEVCATCCVTE